MELDLPKNGFATVEHNIPNPNRFFIICILIIYRIITKQSSSLMYHSQLRCIIHILQIVI